MLGFVAALIQKTGVLGIGLLMLLENVIPVIPSELIMPMAGFEAARGQVSPFWAVAAGTLGSILGGIVWYWVGRKLGFDGLALWSERGGRWLPLLPSEVRRGHDWFKRWGAGAVCVGRCLPGIRGMISVPAGMVRMPFAQFLLWSSLGALIWSVLLTWAGYALQDHYSQVGQWMNPVSDVFLGFCLITYAIRVMRYKRPAIVPEKA